MKKFWVLLVLIACAPLLSSCLGTAVYYGTMAATTAVGAAAGAGVEKAAEVSARRNKLISSFSEGISTEESVRSTLDDGYKLFDEWKYSDHSPPAKVLFYERNNRVNPILFVYDENKEKFIYQQVGYYSEKEFNEIKDSENFRSNIRNWHSQFLSKKLGNEANPELKQYYADKLEQVQPIGSWGYNGLAWYYATCPHPQYRNAEKAVTYGEKALSLSRSWQILDTAAAAYAEAGDFSRAEAFQKEAVSACTNSKSLRELELRLAQYEKKNGD